MKKILTVCIIVIVTVVLGWLWFDNKTIKPEDEISCAIAKEVGNDVEYLGTRDYKEDELCYKYLVQKQEKDVLFNITAIVNETIQREKISNKVDIYFCYEIPGAIGNAARLCNYSQNELLAPDCGGLQRLVIAGNDFSEGDFFLMISIHILLYQILDTWKFQKKFKKWQSRKVLTGTNTGPNWKVLKFLNNHTSL